MTQENPESKDDRQHADYELDRNGMSLEDQFLSGNKLIAKFDGKPFVEFHGMICECEEDGSPWDNDPIEWLHYHSDWNLLMPVVEKIESIQCLGIDKTYIQINDKSCAIWTYFDVKEFLRITGDDKNEDGKFKVKISAKTKIQAVYQAVIDFITWYNSQPTL